MDFLGEIPLDIMVRETSDGGHPIVAAEPESAIARAYIGIAEALAHKIDETLARRAAAAPKIVIQ
jgi:ATP-binding protein involved in chromosome partitioning